jgi:hypothetical protein
MEHFFAAQIHICEIGYMELCCGLSGGQQELHRNFLMTGNACASEHSSVLHLE